jgi:predicted anti-sigma-YlaC factor YlaD
MTGDHNNLSCHEFQMQLADLIGSGKNASSHPHLQTCDRCRALLADLETIAEAARQLLPIQQPKEDLWERIESAIKKDEGSPNPK